MRAADSATTKIEGVAPETLIKSAAMYLAQKAILKKHGANAITINCLGGFYGGHFHAKSGSPRPKSCRKSSPRSLFLKELMIPGVNIFQIWWPFGKLIAVPFGFGRQPSADAELFVSSC